MNKSTSIWQKIGIQWRRFTTWKSNKCYDFKDQIRKNLVKVTALFIAVAIGLIVMANVLPRASNMQSSELNKAQQFGSNGKSATLTTRTFNPDTGTLLLSFDLQDNTNTDSPVIDLDRIKLKLDGESYQKNDTAVMVIPTSNHTVDVQFTNLKSNFRMVNVSFIDEAVNTNAIDTVALASSSSETKDKQEDKQMTRFIINKIDTQIDQKLPVENQTQLAIKQVDRDIEKTKNNIKLLFNSIDKWNESIKEQQTNISLAQESMAHADPETATSLARNVESYKSAIETANRKIEETNNKITAAQVRVQTLQDNRNKIANGQLSLPKPY